MTTLTRSAWWQPGSAAGVESWPVVPREDEPGAASRLAFRSLMVFMVMLLLAPQNHVPALRPLRIALVAAVVGVIARLAASAHRREALTVGGAAMAATAALVGWAVVTAPLSQWPGGSVSFLLNDYLKTVAIFWLLANAVDTLHRLGQMAWALTLLSVPLAVTGVRNYFAGAFIEVNHAVRRVEGYDAGLTSNPNDLALMLNLILPLSLALLVAARSVSARLALLAIVALQAACVIVTFSRAGFLTLAVVVAAFGWRLLRRGRFGWSAALAAVALAGLALVPSGYVARLATITDIASDATGSAQDRWRDTVAAGEFLRDHPVVGAGIGMNALAVNDVRGAKWTEVHNAYLEYGVELGLPGLALFLVLLAVCLRTLWRVRRSAARIPGLERLSWLAEGLVVSMTAFAVAAFFHPIAYHFYFYLVAGLAIAAGALWEKAVGRAEALPLGVAA